MADSTSTSTLTAQTSSTIAHNPLNSAHSPVSSHLEHFSTILAQRSTESDDGSVLLQADEAKALIDTLKSTLESFLDKPATTRDMLLLLDRLESPAQLQFRHSSTSRDSVQLDRSSASIVTGSTSKFKRIRMRSDPAGWTEEALPSTGLASSLPADILVMIVDHLRDLYDVPTSDRPYSAKSSRHRNWDNVKSLALLNKTWYSALRPLILQELHLTETKALPKFVKALRCDLDRAVELKRLYINIYLFEFSGTSSDYGFSLPDLIRLVPTLVHLEITIDRGSGRAFHREIESSSFDSFTGGLRLPAVICTANQQLRTLVYNAPCHLQDIVSFAKLPNIVSLDVLGDVEPVFSASRWTTCSPTLRRLWAPTAVFSHPQLAPLIQNSALTGLAFTFDIDGVVDDGFRPPSEGNIRNTLSALERLFEKVGPRLKELLVMAPFADSRSGDDARRGGFQNLMATIALAIAGAGPPPPFGAPDVGQPGPQAPPEPEPAPAPMQNAARANRATIAARRPDLPNAPRVAGPVADAGGDVAGEDHGLANNGGEGAAGPGGPGGGPPLGVIINIPAARRNLPPTPFFEALLQYCPSLAHLELYGRRYSSGLVDHLRALSPHLEHLALSVPSDEEKSATAEGLLRLVKDGALTRLRRLELNGRGGDWGAAERRSFKEACELRKVAYASTDLKDR